MSLPTNIQLTSAEFQLFKKLVYVRAGIAIDDQKVAMLSNRLRRRLRTLHLETYMEYYQVLKQCEEDAEEMSHFLSAVSTNETYFFRNEKLWQFVGSDLVKRFCEANKSMKVKTVSFWSAASSSGEEAYTLAIVLKEKLPRFDSWKIEIVGTDISQRVLDTAKARVYKEYALQKIDAGRRRKLFNFKEGDTEFRLKDEIRGMVDFRRHNLREPFGRSKFDVVFLRNVMMYFDHAMKVKVMKNVCAALKPGGLFVTGDVDPLRDGSGLAELGGLRFVRSNTYEKVAAAEQMAGTAVGG